MKKALIAYYSRTGNTEKMANYIAEGIRIDGNEAVVKSISSIKKDKDLQNYDGYILGCPTYYSDMTDGMKTFLFIVDKAQLQNKIGGTFGSYSHSGNAPAKIFDTMEHVFKMDMTDLGAFNLKDDILKTDEGLRACQEYGKSLSQKMGK
ncbi:MAG: flavodoxin domain-containing protein [Spirochaetota bacterium]|nr:flavodoxin domain-containing protein [Spirochaetota bacterium]